MFGRVIRLGIVIAALILAGGAWAQAQTPDLRIGFDFIAAGKMFKAGNYSVGVASNGNVVLTPEKGGAGVEIPQIKTLSQRDVQRAELVFDVSGTIRYLTEAWVPGKGGILVGKVDDPQARDTVRGPKLK